MAVGLNSSNTDADALGENEGAVIGSRTPKHKHTVVQPTITSSQNNFPVRSSSIWSTAGLQSVQGVASEDGTLFVAPDISSSASGGTVGPRSNAPTDTAAYLTVNYIIKY